MSDQVHIGSTQMMKYYWMLQHNWALMALLRTQNTKMHIYKLNEMIWKTADCMIQEMWNLENCGYNEKQELVLWRETRGWKGRGQEVFKAMRYSAWNYNTLAGLIVNTAAGLSGNKWILSHRAMSKHVQPVTNRWNVWMGSGSPRWWWGYLFVALGPT